ncbi:MAG: DUF167 domain-containing protein [Candidatus Omnitrophica bacterium]|nr:DUF167 domain-containing protein [Candidatus Omnitrophota bacterium]
MYIKVKVLAGQKREKFEQIKPDKFEIAIKQPAERNLANERVLELVARHFKTSVNRVRIVSGHTSPSKILSIPDEI